MIATIKEEWRGGRCLKELTCSEIADLMDLPKSADDVAPGSTCICTEDCAVYMLGADDVWHQL